MGFKQQIYLDRGNEVQPQLTAYEIPLLITVLGVAVLSGSLNIIEIVDFQMGEDEGNVWNFFMMPLGTFIPNHHDC